MRVGSMVARVAGGLVVPDARVTGVLPWPELAGVSCTDQLVMVWPVTGVMVAVTGVGCVMDVPAGREEIEMVGGAWAGVPPEGAPPGTGICQVTVVWPLASSS